MDATAKFKVEQADAMSCTTAQSGHSSRQARLVDRCSLPCLFPFMNGRSGEETGEGGGKDMRKERKERVKRGEKKKRVED